MELPPMWKYIGDLVEEGEYEKDEDEYFIDEDEYHLMDSFSCTNSL